MRRALLAYALKAWFLGLSSAGLVFLPLMMATSGFVYGGLWQQIEARAPIYFSAIPIGLGSAFTFGIVLSFPLFVVAYLVSLAFSKQIAARPNLFLLLAPLITAGLVASLYAATRENSWSREHGYWEIFGVIVASWDTLIFALPVVPAAFYFCHRLKFAVSGNE
jgi:hypothetical protein